MFVKFTLDLATVCRLAVKRGRLGREPVLLTSATGAQRQLGGATRGKGGGGGVASEPRPNS